MWETIAYFSNSKFQLVVFSGLCKIQLDIVKYFEFQIQQFQKSGNAKRKCQARKTQVMNCIDFRKEL